MVCANKLIQDGYCDISSYIESDIPKSHFSKQLTIGKSPVRFLYKPKYPTKETAFEIWREWAEKYADDLSMPLSNLDAQAIVYWIYAAYKTPEERVEQTRRIFSFIEEQYDVQNLSIIDGVIFKEDIVDLHIIRSFGEYIDVVQELDFEDGYIFYRGHANANYVLLPSVLRKASWTIHEQDMYNEARIECPNDFEKCKSHLDYLVHMQHYGLPTRLLDITKNPLVALYFACVDLPNDNGEVVVFKIGRKLIKYPKSDAVSILAALPLLKGRDRKELYDWATTGASNNSVDTLFHNIRLEKPAFENNIRPKDVLACLFVQPEKKNNRIIKQDGAFIICGLLQSNKTNTLNQYRFSNYSRKQIFIIKKSAKPQILEILDKLSINESHLFPEIADVTNYIKSKY